MNAPDFGPFIYASRICISIKDVLEECDLGDLFAHIICEDRDRAWILIQAEFDKEIEVLIEERT